MYYFNTTPSTGMYAMSLMNDEKEFIVPSNDIIARIWDIETEKTKGLFEGHLFKIRWYSQYFNNTKNISFFFYINAYETKKF